MGISESILNNENNYRSVIEFIQDGVLKIGIAERNFEFNKFGFMIFVAILVIWGFVFFFTKREEKKTRKNYLENPMVSKGILGFLLVTVVISLFICSFRMGKFKEEAELVKIKMIDQLDEHLDREEIVYLLGDGYNKYLTDDAKYEIIFERYYKKLRHEF